MAAPEPPLNSEAPNFRTPSIVSHRASSLKQGPFVGSFFYEGAVHYWEPNKGPRLRELLPCTP